MYNQIAAFYIKRVPKCFINCPARFTDRYLSQVGFSTSIKHTKIACAIYFRWNPQITRGSAHSVSYFIYIHIYVYVYLSNEIKNEDCTRKRAKRTIFFSTRRCVDGSARLMREPSLLAYCTQEPSRCHTVDTLNDSSSALYVLACRDTNAHTHARSRNRILTNIAML